MSNKIVGQCNGVEIDVKRFYVPGVTVESNCPKCDIKHMVDLGSDYLSHPMVGVPESVFFYCESEKPGGGYCSTEWAVPVILDISVRLA